VTPPSPSPPGRILALDHGERRIGIAWTDPLRIATHPGGVLERRTLEEDLQAIAQLCADREVTLVIVGLPVNMDGSEGPQAAQARAFMEALAGRLTQPVQAFDERLTTVEADRILDLEGVPRGGPRGRRLRRQRRDALAASLLLEAYLGARGGCPDATRGQEGG
jgi:putative Holliday junction resolvase